MDDFEAAAIVIILLGVLAVVGFGAGSLPSQPVQPSPLSYRQLARQDALQAGIDPDLFERQINQESGFNPGAVSPAGAIGIAQIMPATAAVWGVDPHDPVSSLQAAASAMAQYYNSYHSYPMALACYNAGCGALNDAISQCGSGWRGCLPSETRAYITAIWN